MKKKFKLGVIGCGYMATAILRGAVLSDFLPGKKIVVSDVIEENLDNISDELGVFTCTSNKYIAENSEFVLLAVNKRNFEGVMKSLGGVAPDKVISLISGVTKKTLKAYLGLDARIARCVPNIAMSIGSGAIAIDMNDFNSDRDDLEFINNLLGNTGTLLSVNEDKLDAAAGLSGSGPAYVFMFIDSLIDAGISNGLTGDEAKLLAVQTVLGSAEMVLKDNQTLSDLIMSACSKGGIAVEGVKTLEDKDFRGIVAKAVEAGVKRSKELSET